MIGAGEESRTLDLNLGKVALYQLSYSRFKLKRILLYLLQTYCLALFEAKNVIIRFIEFTCQAERLSCGQALYK